MVQQDSQLEFGDASGWAASLSLLPEGMFCRDDSFSIQGAFGVLNRDRFLSELNSLRDCPQNISELRRSVLLHHLPGTPVLMNAQLRLYVDEWLDTGVKPDGVEDPRTRDLTKAPNACYAVGAFASRQRFWLEPAADGLYLRFPNERELRGISSPNDSALDQANRLFTLFFLCGWRFKLAKCRRCENYFELKHSNRVYKRGTACYGCTRVRSAEFSTSKARKMAQAKLYRLVARRFRKRISKCRDWHRDAKLRAEIVDFLNEQLGENVSLLRVYRRWLTGKWLSWSKNRDGIERAVRGKVHVEG